MPIARKEWDAVDQRVPRLTINLAPGAPPGTKVTRDGLELEGASLGVALAVDPGKHEIVVSAPKHEDMRRTVTLSLREQQALQVTVGVGDPLPELAEGDGTDESTEGKPAERDALAPVIVSSGGGLKTIGFVAGGIGLAGLALGGAALYQAHDVKSTSDADYEADNPEQGAADYRRAEKWQTASTVSFAIGGAALATGAVLVLTVPMETTAGMRVAPMMAAGTAGVSVAGAW